MKKILTLAAVLMLFACSQKPGSAPSASASGDYIAKVNGAVITTQDYKDQLKDVPEQLRGELLAGNGKGFINGLISKELLYQEAVKKGMDKDPKLDAAVKEYRKEMLIQMLMDEQIGNKVSVSDEEVKSFYDQNKDKLRTGKGKPLPFDQVKNQLRQYLLKTKKQEALQTGFKSYVDSLQKAAADKIEINETALKAANASSNADSNTPGK